MAEEIARLTTVWDANFQKLDEKLNKVIRSHHAAASRIKKDSDTFTRQLEEKYGRVGKAMGNVFNDSRLATINAGSSHLRVFGSALEPLGVAGLAAAAGIAALAVAGQQAIAAMRFADEIDDTAQKLMIGTDALQEFRFAMTEVGGTAADADGAIESFNKTLGLAQSGLSPKAMKGFAALGFTQEQLQSFGSGEQLLTEVAGRIADLSKESEQAAVAEKLGLGAMLPLLREGAAGMEALRQKAQDMGIVMDSELVAKGAQANQEFETMARVIDVELKSAFVGLSDEVVGFTRNIADALKALNEFLGKYNEHNAKVGTMFPGLDEAVSRRDGFGALGILGRGFVTGDAERRRRTYNAGGRSSVDAEGIARLMELPPAAGSGTLDRPPPRGGGGRSNREAEQRARRQEQFEKQLDRVQAELLRAYDAQFQSIENDAGYKLAQLQNEHEAALREIVAAEKEYVESDGLRGLAATEADQLRSAQAAVMDAERREIEWKERQALEEYRFQTEQDAADAAIELLDIQAGMAVTAKERHEAERRILALTLKAEREAQKRDLANSPEIDDEERARLLAEGDRGRQARYDAQGRSSDGARMARGVVGEIREPQDNLQAAADAYAEIQRLRDQDVLSEQEAALAKAMINADYQQKRLTGEGTMLNQMAALQGSSIKELAALGKAAALAQATIDGYAAIQVAWKSAPFPLNLPIVAVTTAATAANVAAIAGVGFRDGGYTGDGPEGAVAGPVHRKEYVFDAASTRRIGRSTLDALRSGSPLIAGLNTEGAAPMLGGARGGTFTYSPTIDARGATMEAARHFERVLAEHQRNLPDIINGVRDRRASYRMGGRRPK